MLEERFNEDELKQLVAWLEIAAVARSTQQMGPEMQRALAEKLVADTRPSVEPKLRALQQIRMTQEAAGAGAAAAARLGRARARRSRQEEVSMAQRAVQLLRRPGHAARSRCCARPPRRCSTGTAAGMSVMEMSHRGQRVHLHL